MTVSASELLSLLVAVVASGVVTVAINGYINRNKLGADVTATKADAAATISTTAMAQVVAVDVRVDKLRQALAAHRMWDKDVVAKAKAHGLNIDDPPELWL